MVYLSVPPLCQVRWGLSNAVSVPDRPFRCALLAVGRHSSSAHVCSRLCAQLSPTLRRLLPARCAGGGSALVVCARLLATHLSRTRTHLSARTGAVNAARRAPESRARRPCLGAHSYRCFALPPQQPTGKPRTPEASPPSHRPPPAPPLRDGERWMPGWSSQQLAGHQQGPRSDGDAHGDSSSPTALQRSPHAAHRLLSGGSPAITRCGAASS